MGCGVDEGEDEEPEAIDVSFAGDEDALKEVMLGTGDNPDDVALAAASVELAVYGP
jgi:hypothetical protein